MIQTGKQPSGLAINRAGNLALVANRADNSVSVLSISGKTVAVAGTVALAPTDAPSQQPSAVAITPDGKRALVAKALANKVALLNINGTTVTYKGYDMITGVFPYNVQITADGKLGLVNNLGDFGVSDGQVDTVAVIDMTLDPPRVVDQVVVGDAPEGLAVSPSGGYAVSLLHNGSGGTAPNNAFYRHDHGVAEVDNERELGRLLDGKIGRLCTLQDLVDTLDARLERKPLFKSAMALSALNSCQRRAGDSLSVPAGTIHSHWNASSTERLRFLEFIAADKGKSRQFRSPRIRTECFDTGLD